MHITWISENIHKNPLKENVISRRPVATVISIAKDTAHFVGSCQIACNNDINLHLIPDKIYQLLINKRMQVLLTYTDFAVQ